MNSGAKASRELLKFSAGLIGEEYRESMISKIFARLKIW
jgi:hypothetical protein